MKSDAAAPYNRGMTSLDTERLILRPLAADDAPAIQELAADRRVAESTLLIPHPYPDGAAAEFVDKVSGEGKHAFAITLRDGGALIGVMGLNVEAEHDRAEVGYWIGVPFWGRGYATEALRAVIDYGFESVALHRIYANHFSTNPASGRVLAKAGMQHEGTLRDHYRKWGEYRDAELYAIVATSRTSSRDSADRATS